MRINGEALRAIRERTGYSITELADTSGVDRTTISRIESGRRRGTAAQCRSLAEALDIPQTAISARGDQ